MFGKLFGSVGGFFRDIVAPIGLGLINPALGAAYAGIKTGIQTGSPLAGLGSAGLSLGLSSAFRGMTAGQEASASMSNIIQPGTGPISSGLADSLGIIDPSVISQTAAPITGAATGSSISSGLADSLGIIDPSVISQTSLPTIATTPTSSPSLFQNIKKGLTGSSFAAGLQEAPMVGPNVAGSFVDVLPKAVQEASPLTVGLGGLGLQMAATPPPEPAPFGPMQPQRTTDFSKYGYKGPLGRGDYTYADPEDIAYGRVTPGSYGYLGAKEGGKIKAQGGGVMMQSGPYNPQIEAQKGTFRPTGSMVAPTAGPTISKIAQTQPMMSVSPQKIAGLAQPVAPTVPTTNIPMAQPQAPAPMPMPQTQPQQGGIEQQAQQLISDLPQKDINVNIDQIRQFIGLAEGGKVPTTEKEFARLGVYKRPEDYNTKEMAEGGEVDSNQTLQSNAFVIPADVVGHIGDGSSDAGAQRLQSYLGMNPQQYQAGGIMAGELQGPGGGMDDLIQTSIEGKRAAAVSPQEFVVPRDIVAELGQGSYDKGSNKLYALMRNVRKTKTGTTKQPAELTRGLGQLMRTAVA